jgi:hypothetical protein
MINVLPTWRDPKEPTVGIGLRARRFGLRAGVTARGREGGGDDEESSGGARERGEWQRRHRVTMVD